MGCAQPFLMANSVNLFYIVFYLLLMLHSSCIVSVCGHQFTPHLPIIHDAESPLCSAPREPLMRTSKSSSGGGVANVVPGAGRM